MMRKSEKAVHSPVVAMLGVCVWALLSSLPAAHGATILEARESVGSGTPVTVQGIVTTAELGSILYIQDETAGIGVYAPVGDTAGRGDIVEVTGTVVEFNGLTEFGAGTTLTVISSDNPLPAPVVITIDQLNNSGEDYEGRLVKVENVLPVGGGTFSGETNYDFSDADDFNSFFYVRIDRDTDIPGTPIPSSELNVTGVLGQYQENYQLFPRSREDLEVVGGDFDPPTVLEVDPLDDSHLLVAFSEALDPATALDPARYAIDPGVDVLGAAFDGDADDKVLLTVSAMAAAEVHDLTVNGVEDGAGNAGWDFVSFMPGVVPISRAELSQDGDFIPDLVEDGFKITIEGTVISPNFQTGNRSEYVMQDATGGLTLYSPAFDAQLQRGDFVRVRGTMDSFRGKEEIVPPSLLEVEILARGQAEPEPREISLEALMTLPEADREAIDGTLIELTGVEIDPFATWPEEGQWANLDIYDPEDPLNLFLTLRIDDVTDIDGQPYPEGVEAVIGIFGQYDGFNCDPCNAGYQILPRAYADFFGGAVTIAEPEIIGIETVPVGAGSAVLITYTSETDGVADLEYAPAPGGPWDVLVENIPMQAGIEGQYQDGTESIDARFYRLVAEQ